MKLVHALALTFLTVVIATDDGCTPESCFVVKCAALTPKTCPNGVIKVKGGFCGCCDACLDKILEGEDCTATCKKPVSAACEPGTTCKRCGKSWTCQR